MELQNRIAEAFPAGNIISRRTIDSAAQNTRLYVIFIIARSGSTLLTQLAKDYGLGTPQEWFNEDWIHGSEPALDCLPPRALNASSADDYVKCITRQYQSSQGIFGTQLSQFQTNCLAKMLEDGAHALRIMKPFYLRRRNLVAQAISLDRSVRSGLFHSYQKTRELVSRYDALEYDADSIEHWCRHLLADEMFFADFFAEKSISVENLFYEDLIADPQAVLARMEHVITGKTSAAPVAVNSTLTKLGDQKSDEWEKRFRHERAAVIERLDAQRRLPMPPTRTKPTMTMISAGSDTTLPTPAQQSAGAPERYSRTETPFGSMVYLSNDDPIGESLTRYGEWARAEIDLIAQFVPMGSTVIDVGANIGTHAIPFARLTGPHGRVIAFEPQPEIFGLLSTNAAENGLDQIHLIQAGASSSPGEMFLPEINYDDHINSGAVALAASSGKSKVDVVTLDSLHITACNFIKIDAEGMEIEVLKGAAQLIRRHAPTLLMEVNTVERAIELYRHVERLGYSVFFVRTKAFNPENFKACADNLFGVANETSLLCLHEKSGRPRVMQSPLFDVHAIDSTDSLAALHLASPRFGDSTAHDRDPRRLNEEIERERTTHGETTSKLKLASYRATLLDRQVDTLDAEIRVLRQQLRQFMDQSVHLSTAQNQIASLRGELDQLRVSQHHLLRSTSWRITRPLRAVRRLAKR